MDELRMVELREAADAVLGTLLHDGIKDLVPDLVSALEPADFPEPRDGELWDVLCSLRAAGRACDPIMVTAALREAGDLDRHGGPVRLHQLHDAVPTVAHALHYAEILREDATWRALSTVGTQAASAAAARQGTAADAAQRAVEAARAVRDRGIAAEEDSAVDLLDLIAEADQEPDWVIPGVLARWDRLILTGGEGGGKSLMLRQIAVRAAAGLHPWRKASIKPVKALIVDVENSRDQVRPWLAKMHAAAEAESVSVERGALRVVIRPEGVDLTQPVDRARLLRLVEAEAPDLIVIGPLYKLAAPRAGEAAEDSARALMTALEAVRAASGGAALLIEAHSPHASQGRRDLRPIGSSLWLRWPEFGFGLDPVSSRTEPGAEELRLCDWTPWRGSRSERSWPARVCQGVSWPWQAVQYRGNEPMVFTVEDQGVVPAGFVPEQPEFWDHEQIG
ncbi:AAA family ATPase [Streptomyces halstedii]|uniref:AAA family ATPase n=1 Tax=Streptomyces halstedii TaxID=1944 RepID=A0ABS6U253_STRHA|nr:AAA family ATPase [Streptomyces halstedii]MBV7674361.1 AAA family ATPase [Streptomyces halstedii]